MTTRQPVVFTNASGDSLVGIARMPAGVPRDEWVILLSPGVKMRVAPHRLYVHVEERLIAAGFPVLRFDFSGTGDSGGEAGEDLLAAYYATVQIGRYVEETRLAMDFLTREHGARRFVLAGLCGGGITGLLAAAVDERVAGVCGLGVPVILDQVNVDKRQFMSDGQLDRLGRMYLRKLLNPRAWLRLLSFRTDYRLLLRSVIRRLGLARPASPRPAESGDEAGTGADDFNDLFPKALFDVTDGERPVQLLFSDTDRLYSEYREKFVSRYAEPLGRADAFLDVRVIERANHVLSSPQARDTALDCMVEFLDRWFPATEGAGRAGGVG